MQKILLLVLALSGMARFAGAQSFDPLLAATLQLKIDSLRAANNLRGISACVLYPGVGKWQGVSGVSHAGTPINSDMLFGIASNTKLFTAVLLLRLAEQGLVDLDDSLHTYLPTYNNIDPNIRIRQLLNHTSGLADVTSVPGYPDSILSNPLRLYTAAELMGWAGPPLFAAGTGWSYCNTNYLLAGMIAESVGGQSYAQLLRDNLLSPLQLDSTFLDVYDSLLYTVAHPWQAGVDNFAVPRRALNSAAWAAGAMYSTAGEMAQWYQALMSGQVLQPASFGEMTTFVGTGNYGLGISRAMLQGRTVWQHGGTIWGGYNSFMLYETSTGIVICVLINQLPGQAMLVAGQLLTTLLNNPVSSSEVPGEEALPRIYPNPVTDLLTVELPGQPLLQVQLFGAAGQLLREGGSSRLPVADLPAGLYWLAVQTKSGRRVYPFVKR